MQEEVQPQNAHAQEAPRSDQLPNLTMNLFSNKVVLLKRCFICCASCSVCCRFQNLIVSHF
jgi:hypothetical protein